MSRAYKVKVEKICVECGEPFTPKAGNAIVCSDDCRKKRQRRLTNESKKRIREAERKMDKDYRRKKYIPPNDPLFKSNSRGIEFEELTAEQKTFYGRTQQEAYKDELKVIIPSGLQKAKDRKT